MAEQELAMAKYANGSPVARSAATVSALRFLAALAAVGGKAPKDLVWTEARGWHRPSSGRPEGLSLAAAQRR